MLHILIVSSDFKFADSVTKIVLSYPGVNSKDIHKYFLSTESDVLHQFREVEETIASFLCERDIVHDRFVGILQANAYCAGNIHPLSSCQGSLILSFPEIQWIPVYNSRKDAFDEKAGTMSLERAVKLCRNGYSPLFDGDGLRSRLMLGVRGDSDNITCYARTDVALAVDEEVNFAQMNAYTAYRFGYRAYSISSMVAADNLLYGNVLDMPVASTQRDVDLGDRDFRNRLSAPVAIVFEDVQLQFPDDTGKRVRAFGAKRDDQYQLLHDANLRIVATAARVGEAIAKSEDGKQIMSEDYFRGRKNGRNGVNRSLYGIGIGQRLNCFLKRACERLDRWSFNVSGGWVWYWPLKMLDVLLMAAVLFGVFFWKVSLVLPILFGLFVARGLLRFVWEKIGGLIGCLPKTIRMFFVYWSQRHFLPQRYRNHCPENGIGKNKDTYWAVVHKPLAGIFGLRNACCLPNGRGFQGLYDTARVKEECRRAQQGDYAEQNNDDISHAAPGMAMEIAVRLLRRAEWLEAEGKIIDAEGAIHGAVLATVAGELLDAKTPAVSIEALTWKQYFEIRAECEFVGVQAHTDIVDRFIDIHNAMRRICKSPDGLVREDVYTSGMAELMDKLSSLLSDKGKPEEALFFAKKARLFHRRLMNPMARSLLAYPEWLLRSAWHVVLSLIVIATMFCWYWKKEIQPGCPISTALARTYEMLICDEPDLSWPGKDEPSWFAINGPFQEEAGKGTSNIWELCPTKMPEHVKSSREAEKARDAENDIKFENSSKSNDSNLGQKSSCESGLTRESFSVFVHTMRQIALLHLAFLGLCFWDAMRQK